VLYMTAGQIIPAVTGTSWDENIQQRIFGPLRMNHSNVSTTLCISVARYSCYRRGWSNFGSGKTV
jgi:CubicO group peptidase (beta-lactamase class C family)